MLFTNVECEIKTKRSKGPDAKDYRFIEFGDRVNGALFLACNIKGFDKINVGFHNKISVGMSKKDNPKVIYSPDDKDLYLLLKGEKNSMIAVTQSDYQGKFDLITSAEIAEGDSFTHFVLVKIHGDENVTFVLGENSAGEDTYVNVNKKFVKSLKEFKSDAALVAVK